MASRSRTSEDAVDAVMAEAVLDVSPPARRVRLAPGESESKSKIEDGRKSARSASAAMPSARGAAAPVTTLTVREQAFVPKALAMRQIEVMQGDMHAMKDRLLGMMKQMQQHYDVVEAETKAQFMGFIDKLRASAETQVYTYKNTAARLQTELDEVKELSMERIEYLEEKVAQLEADKTEALTSLQSAVQSTSKVHSEALAALQAEAAEKGARVTELEAKLAEKKAAHKERLTAEVTKWSGLVQARDVVILTLEMDRRRLITALNQLHAARDDLAGALSQMEVEARSAVEMQGAGAVQLHQRMVTAEAEVASLRKRYVEAETRNAQVVAEVRGKQEALDAANAALANAKAAFSASAADAAAAADGGDASAALQGAFAQIAMLKADLASAQAAAAAASAESKAAVAAAGAAGAAAAAAAPQARGAPTAADSAELTRLRSEVKRLQAGMAEVELLRKIAAAEGKSVPAPAAPAAPPPPAAVPTADDPDGLLASVAVPPAARVAISEGASAYANRLQTLLDFSTRAVQLGQELWVDKKKRQALKLYQQTAVSLEEQLPEGVPLHTVVKAAIADSEARMAENQPAKAAFALKQAIDTIILEGAVEIDRLMREASSGDVDVTAMRAELERMRAANAAAGVAPQTPAPAYDYSASAAGSGSAAAAEALARAEAAEASLAALQMELERLRAELEAARAGGDGDDKSDGGDDSEAEKEREREEEAAAAAEEEEAAAAAASGKGGAPPAKGSAAASAASAAAGGKALNPRDANKLKEQEKTIKDLRDKVRKLETAAKAAGGPAAKGGAAAGGDDKAVAAAVEKRQQMLEKKFKKEKEDMEASQKREVDVITRKLNKATAEASETAAALAAVTSERDDFKKRLASMGRMEEEMAALRLQAEEAVRLRSELEAANARVAELDKLYRDEQILRKRYYNVIEDMKGKVRVYCRARPMSKTELDRGNYSVVSFPDEVTIDIDTGKGHKQFVYDQCFGVNSTQEQVFADTELLIQSAFDGYNVSIFAYGQTGSGKTHTMVGSRDMPGITPRAVRRLFELVEKNKGVYDVTVECYMVELYLDSVIDLFWRVENPKERSEPPKLDIKKDEKGLVVIKGVIMKPCPSADALLELFDAGNLVRHVGATAMNATSSRSHLIFAILINSYNKQTKKTATGKLSLIDLAGSERVGKTGASAERLKEAQAINKSLSALGNVISALSTNEKFIPYRDNKLTLMMSDSLGGNAKTLMFVNLSPADYNAEETQTSLVYASRVKLITNNAEKMQESQEIAKLKKIIAALKAGVAVTEVVEEEPEPAPSASAAGDGGGYGDGEDGGDAAGAPAEGDDA